MKAQARRAKPHGKAAKRKGPGPDPTLNSRIPGYVPRPSRAHPGSRKKKRR